MSTPTGAQVTSSNSRSSQGRGPHFGTLTKRRGSRSSFGDPE
jgi:hypothetical protein